MTAVLSPQHINYLFQPIHYMANIRDGLKFLFAIAKTPSKKKMQLKFCSIGLHRHLGIPAESFKEVLEE